MIGLIGISKSLDKTQTFYAWASHPIHDDGDNRGFEMPINSILVILEKHKGPNDDFAEYRTISEHGLYWVDERNIEPL